MKKMDFLPRELTSVRYQKQQLKVTMNLPVRFVTDNQIVDVLPIEADPTLPLKPKLGYLLCPLEKMVYPTPDELIIFFRGCQFGDLVTTDELAEILQITRWTVTRLAKMGKLKNHRLNPSQTLYKLSELPPVINFCKAEN